VEGKVMHFGIDTFDEASRTNCAENIFHFGSITRQRLICIQELLEVALPWVQEHVEEIFTSTIESIRAFRIANGSISKSPIELQYN
jgi:hypothetical protein